MRNIQFIIFLFTLPLGVFGQSGTLNTKAWVPDGNKVTSSTIKGSNVLGVGNKIVSDTLVGVAIILTQGQVVLGWQRVNDNLEPIEGEGYNVGAVEAMMVRYREPDDPKLTKSYTISYWDFNNTPIPSDDVLLFKIRQPVINKPKK